MLLWSLVCGSVGEGHTLLGGQRRPHVSGTSSSLLEEEDSLAAAVAFFFHCWRLRVVGFARTLLASGAVDVPAAVESAGFFLPFFLSGACPLAGEGIAAAPCSASSLVSSASSLALRFPWPRRAGVVTPSSATGTSAIEPSAVPLRSLRLADLKRIPSVPVGPSGLAPVEGPATSPSPSTNTSSTSAITPRLALPVVPPELPAEVDRVGPVGFEGVATRFSAI